MTEVFWMLKVYPFLVSKKSLRFFYLYSLTRKTGITIEETADVLIYIALQQEENYR